MAEYVQTKFDSKSFNPVAFGKYVERIPSTKRNELIKSRALRGNPQIKAAFSSQTGTAYATIPMTGASAAPRSTMTARPTSPPRAPLPTSAVSSW